MNSYYKLNEKMGRTLENPSFILNTDPHPTLDFDLCEDVTTGGGVGGGRGGRASSGVGVIPAVVAVAVDGGGGGRRRRGGLGHGLQRGRSHAAPAGRGHGPSHTIKQCQCLWSPKDTFSPVSRVSTHSEILAIMEPHSKKMQRRNLQETQP